MLESMIIFPNSMTGTFWSEQFKIRLSKDFKEVNDRLLFGQFFIYLLIPRLKLTFILIVLKS